MRASSKTLLLATFAAVVAVPCFVGVQDAQAQAPAGPALTPYPACTIKPTPQDNEAAHSAYNLGKRFFEESDYGSASHNFMDAFKLDCTKPELLLNIARANELLGNRREAVHALETYLQRSPTMSADDKLQLQRRIDNLKAAIAAQMPAPAPVATVVAPPAPTVAVPAPAPLPPPVEERKHTILPWIVTGIGGAAAISGLVVYIVGSGDVSTAKNECPKNKCPTQSDFNTGTTGNSLETAGSVVLYTGLGVAAAGVLWHFLEPTGPATVSASATAPRASFTPMIGPGLAGGSVVGRF
jgi:hypothetical protein